MLIWFDLRQVAAPIRAHTLFRLPRHSKLTSHGRGGGGGKPTPRIFECVWCSQMITRSRREENKRAVIKRAPMLTRRRSFFIYLLGAHLHFSLQTRSVSPRRPKYKKCLVQVEEEIPLACRFFLTRKHARGTSIFSRWRGDDKILNWPLEAEEQLSAGTFLSPRCCN